MKISEEDLKNLKNMDLEAFKNFVKRDDINKEKINKRGRKRRKEKKENE